MKDFIIEDKFWDIFRESKIGIVLCSNIDNTSTDEDKFEEMIRKSEITAHNYITKEIFSENDVIKEWREAYQKFKTKKGARSSIEALLNRVSKNNQINSINPLEISGISK